MTGWGQILRQHYRDMLAELERVAPDSLVAIRARLVLEIAEGLGVKAPGRKTTAAADAKRRLQMDKIVARDKSDAEVKRLYEGGLSVLEVGRQMGGRSQAWVKASLDRTFTPTRPRGNGSAHPPDHERIERLRAMRAEGKTLEEMGAAEHVTRERVRQICLAAGIDTRPSAELTPLQRAAVADYVAGNSLNVVAVKYDVGSQAVRQWIIRAGHVPRLATRRPTASTKRRAEKAATLYRQGKTARDIADALGFKKPEQIYRYLAIAGISPNRQPKSGRHGLRQ